MIELTLTLDQTTYPAPAQPRATIRLANVGDTAQIVNKRFALNYSDAAAYECEIKLMIHNNAGDELPFTSRVNIGDPADRHFAELGPGQSLAREYALARTYDVSTPGRYTIQALYQNQTDPSIGPAWKGELLSNTVAFEIAQNE
ncbi:MAG TPA: hypothetical protein PLG23_09270 [Thermoflexales bacterium]|jgi:hypothetical protein|nr:hypothetical protein [Anaerolineae bacterium]HQX10612.1 hypothetical protein [Thermoflexales bacterium]HQY23747.1 hypothetical protein [Thermoflexales bacterium]HQZ53641.1 hypothetical protein [Thermoflexales bacterium]HRA53113.1 hypothetical protein [Thermoflexales bacterium]